MVLAAPVEKDGFSYAAGDFYAEASGHNRHRRATIPELRALFKNSTDAKDNPAHWYEAQLLHYGLRPSKTKGTAKMRPFEATSAGNLVVPAHIARIETDLKKEWSKRDREAKRALKDHRLPAPPASKETKRKSDDGTDLGGGRIASVSIKLNGAVDIQFVEASKKSKISATTASESKPTSASALKASRPKSKAAAPKRGVDTKTEAHPRSRTELKPKSEAKAKTTSAKPSTAEDGSSPAKAKAQAASTPKKAQIGPQVARMPSSKITADPPAKSPTAAPRTKQTARRGGKSWGGSTRPAASASSAPPPPPANFPSDGYFSDDDDDDDEAPPPYPGPPLGYGDDSHHGGYEDEDDDEPMARLGLLNGRYDIRSPSMEDRQGQDAGDLRLILTLEGNTLWGSFDFGAVHGILYLGGRPWRSSPEKLQFSWRGEDDWGRRYGRNHHGWISFLGGGEIEGVIDWDDGHMFGGWRISGQETRSEISAASMNRQWADLRD